MGILNSFLLFYLACAVFVYFKTKDDEKLKQKVEDEFGDLFNYNFVILLSCLMSPLLVFGMVMKKIFRLKS